MTNLTKAAALRYVMEEIKHAAKKAEEEVKKHPTNPNIDKLIKILWALGYTLQYELEPFRNPDLEI